MRNRLRFSPRELRLACALVPGFVFGQVLLSPIGGENWAICFGLCLGGFAFAIADSITKASRDE